MNITLYIYYDENKRSMHNLYRTDGTVCGIHYNIAQVHFVKARVDRLIMI